MRRSLTMSLVGIMVLAFGLLALTFITDSHPLLGLDLRGGVSVVLKPTKSNVPSSSISKAVDIIRSRGPCGIRVHPSRMHHSFSATSVSSGPVSRRAAG